MKRALFAAVLLLLPAIARSEDIATLDQRYTGLNVSKVSFRTETNLHYQDLIETLPVQPGSPLTSGALLDSVNNLMQRRVFEHVDVEVTKIGNEVELLYFLTPQLTISELDFRGSTILDHRALSRVSGIRTGQTLDLPTLAQAVEKIKVAHQEAGYYQSTITVEITQRYLAPQVILRLDITEGSPTTISQAVLRGVFPEDIRFLRPQFKKLVEGKLAAKTTIEELRKELLRALRNEGYLQAVVRLIDISYQEQSGMARVVFEASPHQPLSIVFRGNTRFTAEELISLLGLEQRTLPFGPEAIPHFVRLIRGKYQEAGYYFAAIVAEELERDERRNRYLIRIEEGEPYRLKNLEFRGNTQVSSTILSKVVETKTAASWLTRWKPGIVVEDQVESDRVAIVDYYRGAGFLNTEVTAEVTRLTAPRELSLSFQITEGTQLMIQSVEMFWVAEDGTVSQTLPAPDLTDLQSEVTIGAPFSVDVLEIGRRSLVDQLKNRGFPNARVELLVNETTGQVRYSITPGVRVTLRRIYNAGNIFSHDFVINRELNFQSGDYYSLQAIQDSEQALSRLGLFRSISIQPLDGAFDSPVEDIQVAVDEKNTGSVRLGASINTEDGLHLVSEVAQQNLNGRGTSLTVGLEGYIKSGDRVLDASRSRISYINPRLFDSHVELFGELFAQSSLELSEEFSYDRVGAGLGFRYELSKSQAATWGITTFYEDVFDVEPDLIIGPEDDGNHWISFLRASWEFDRRDDRFNARQGYRTFIEPKIASQVLGSAIEFYGLSVQQSVFSTVAERLVWASGIRGTYLKPYGDTEVIPLTQRLFLGGHNSLRGFSRNAVGPRGFLENIVGGDFSLVLNTELQYEVRPNVVGVLFLDAGQAVLKNEGDFTGDPLSFFSSLRYSPGFGLRYLTPIGPLGLDLGFALDRELGERFGRLYFSIGQAF